MPHDPRLLGKARKQWQSGAEENATPRRLASCPQACAALSRQQTYRTPALWPAGGQVPPHCHHCPWPRPHSGIPIGHSAPEGSGRPGSSLPPRAVTQGPHRVGTPCLSIIEGELTCPWVPGTGHVRWARSPHPTGAEPEPLRRGGLSATTRHQSWGWNQGCPTWEVMSKTCVGQAGLKGRRTVYLGGGSAGCRQCVHPESCPGNQIRKEPPRPPPCTPHTHTHMMHTQGRSHTRSHPHMHIHTGMCTLTHSRSVSLQGLDTEGKQYRAGMQSRGHLF